MCARLRGSAFQLAMRMTTTRYTLSDNTAGATLVTTEFVGADALALERLPEFTVPTTGQIIPAQSSHASS